MDEYIKNGIKQMLLDWMSHEMTWGSKYFLPHSKQSAYNLWAYYTGRDNMGRLTELERAILRLQVKEVVGDKTFAQLLEEK